MNERCIGPISMGGLFEARTLLAYCGLAMTTLWAGLAHAAENNQQADTINPYAANPSAIFWRAYGERTAQITPYVIPTSARVSDALQTLKSERVCLVRLASSPTQGDRAWLATHGVQLLGLVSRDSFYARVDSAVQSDAVEQSGLVVGVSSVQTQWKIEPRLLSMRAGEKVDLWTRDENQLKLNPGMQDGKLSQMVVPISVLLHDDVVAADMLAQLAPLAEGGAQGVKAMSTIPMVTMHARLANLEAIAALANVQWLEPALPALTDSNAQNRALTGADLAQASPYNLNGAGVGVFVFDGGLVMTNHVALAGRVTVTETGSDSTADHATHCAGTVAGDGDPDANRLHRGMAPAASITTAGVSIAGATGWLYTNPTDIEADYIAAFNAGAVMSSNSIGTNVEPNGFDCTWHGNYGAVSVLLDRLAAGGSATFNQGNPARLVWAAGNERQGSRCAPNTPGFRKLAPPAPSKNLLLIGAVNADANISGDTMTTFSSFGPSDDGRLKPDFCAPGCQVGGDTGVTSSTSASTNSYASFCGTSMACPTVAGLAALLMQDVRAQFPGIPDPRSSTLRAIFASTAVDRGLVGPDYQFGYGSVRIIPAIELARATNFREGAVVQGQVLTFEVLVPEGTPELRITLSWDDVPGNPAIIPQLVNNLDLEVIDPAGLRRGVWRLDPANPGNAATRETGDLAWTDALNNTEQVQVDAPVAGVYTVRVVGTSVPVGSGPNGTGDQSFSIASTSTLRSLGGVPLVYIAARQLAPSLQAPDQPAEVRAAVTAFSDELVANSVLVKYRTGPTGAVQSVAMTSTDGRNFTANLPGFACGSLPRYWFEASGVNSGAITLPSLAASGTTFASSIGAYEQQRSDSLETLTGWTVGGSVWTGRWTNQNPSQTTSPDGVLVYQPEDDGSENGTRCWVTDGRTGTTPQQLDVDGGSTILTSAPIDLTGIESPRVGYSRWFYSYGGGSPLRIEASLDGIAWRDVESVAATDLANARGGWRLSEFSVNALFGVVNPPSVRLRVTATDGNPNDGIVEAAFDEIRVLGVLCRPAGCDSLDFNNDGLFPSDDDLVAFLAALAGQACTTCNDIDFNNDGLFPSDDDLIAYLRSLAGSAC